MTRLLAVLVTAAAPLVTAACEDEDGNSPQAPNTGDTVETPSSMQTAPASTTPSTLDSPGTSAGPTIPPQPSTTAGS